MTCVRHVDAKQRLSFFGLGRTGCHRVCGLVDRCDVCGMWCEAQAFSCSYLSTLLVRVVGMSLGVKRRRTDADGDTAAATNKGDAGGDLAGESPELICEAATRVLQKYSLGVMRVPLEELGVSPLNRKISGTHVHALGRRIVSVEGFVQWRFSTDMVGLTSHINWRTVARRVQQSGTARSRRIARRIER